MIPTSVGNVRDWLRQKKTIRPGAVLACSAVGVAHHVGIVSPRVLYSIVLSVVLKSDGRVTE